MTQNITRCPAAHERRPAGRTQTIPVLGFESDHHHHCISLKQAMEVIRYLLELRTSDSESMAKRFIRHNRKDTVVFDLKSCLTTSTPAGCHEQKTSFLLLDKRIGKSRVGILVPGIITDRREIPRVVRAAAGHKDSKQGEALIDLRELVDAACCVPDGQHLPFPGPGAATSMAETI